LWESRRKFGGSEAMEVGRKTKDCVCELWESRRKFGGSGAVEVGRKTKDCVCTWIGDGLPLFTH
jgi:hypothetical protein